MIAIDTNVLLRYLLEDDPDQAAQSAQLIQGRQPVLITDVVLAETIWTLKGKKYQLKRDEISTVIQALFEEPNLRFENGAAVWLALNDYRDAKPIKGKSADFPDALILNKAKATAAASQQTFRGLYTFDQAAQTLPGTKAPQPQNPKSE
jgi:predicted nucleic-acid-binding protein